MEKRYEDTICDILNGGIKSSYAVDRLGLCETTASGGRRGWRSNERTRVVKPRGGSSAGLTVR